MLLSDDRIKEIVKHPVFVLFLRSRGGKKLRIPKDWTAEQRQLLSDLCVAQSVLDLVSGIGEEEELGILTLWFSAHTELMALHKLERQERGGVAVGND